MQEGERRAIRVWFRQIMKEKGMSANEWATKAGTSPTNITRFLNSDTKYIPSSRTISKLAAVVGSQPGYIIKKNGAQIPVKDASGFTVDMIVDPNLGKVEAFKLGRISGYGGGGIMPYSVIVVDVNAKCKEGDVVAIEDEQFGILVCQLVHKFVMFKTLHWSINKKPISLKDVTIIGKVVQTIMNLADAGDIDEMSTNIGLVEDSE